MQTREELKQYLLNTSLFINNDYLDQYVELVLNYSTTDKYTEKHHILQRCYYKHNNLSVDNSADNLVNLSYKDHCKAHWLLYFCTCDYLKQANECSVRYISEMYKKLTGIEKHKFDFNQDDFNLLQKYMNDIINDDSSRYWSEYEINYLKQNYNGYGSGPKCAKVLNRPLIQVTDKAKHLGLAAVCPDWTLEEIKLIYEYYPIEGDKVYLRIPTHSKDACRAKAKQLKIRTTLHYWTAEEIQILTTNFPLVGAAGCSKLLINRTKNECKHKADRLGLTFINNSQNVWTNANLKLLFDNIDKPIIKLKELLHMNYATIKKQLIKLNKYNTSIHCKRKIRRK